METKIYNVLFLCTGNSARSILAEAILNHLGHDHFKAYSAGSQPKGIIHPYTLEILKTTGIKINQLRSKSWDEFLEPEAPKMDFIFTVCADAADACPVWPGNPVTEHWGMDDPAATTGTQDQKLQAFQKTYRELHQRIGQFISLPFSDLDRNSLQSKTRTSNPLHKSEQ